MKNRCNLSKNIFFYLGVVYNHTQLLSTVMIRLWKNPGVHSCEALVAIQKMLVSLSVPGTER